MANAYRTVNLRPETYERLKMYQVGGKSLNDVVEMLMDDVDPEKAAREALRVHRKRVKALKKGGGLTIEELKRSMGG